MARRKKNKNLKGIPAAIMLILALIGGFAAWEFDGTNVW